MLEENNSKFFKNLTSLNQIKWRVALKGIASGLIVGFLVVLYRLGIEYGTETAVKMYAYLKLHPFIIVLWFIVAMLIGLFIAWLVKMEPMASGGGVPQVEGVLLYGMKMKWYAILIVRFIGGILAAFFGLSLGHEGPSIQIGAAGSKALANKTSKNKLEENCLITGGAAAGLSAAFNAPLSGIVFALEEVHRSFSPLILIAATTASLTSDIVAKYFFGLKPVLSFTTLPQLPAGFYFWLIPLGIFSGLAGALLNKSLLRFQTLYSQIAWYLRPCLALLFALPCGLFLPQVLGGGQNLIQLAQTTDSGLMIMLIILVIKFFFTCTSFGSGVPGGIFLPILSVGSLVGCSFGIAAEFFGLPPEYIPVFAVCAVAGALSGAVKAPITSILLTAEMTGSFIHMLPVAACSFIALFLSDLLKVTPIYEALLQRIIKQKGKVLRNEKLGAILEMPVEIGSSVAGKRISQVNWPKGTLIVAIRRGVEEIVPSGKTRLSPGDYLLILSSDNTFQDMNYCIKELCCTK